MKKLHKIVMLNCNNSDKCIITYKDKILIQAKAGNKDAFKYEIIENGNIQPIELYILSDGEIEEGDWYLVFDIHGKCELPKKADYNKTNEFSLKPYSDYCKKIIAITDKSLRYKSNTDRTTKLPLDFNVPQIPKQFIDYYINEYNKGNIITEVEIDYKNNNSDYGDVGYLGKKQFTLLINKDNTINISVPSNKMYSREEVIKLLNKAWLKQPNTSNMLEEFNNFLNKNL